MKLNPQQAPLYGECVLTVQLNDDYTCPAEGEEEEEFYLLFSGSTQRHLTSTLRVSHVTLQAICPAHNLCEQVLVTLYLAQPGGPVDPHSQETFCFFQDLALDMAHFLLVNTPTQEALLWDNEQIALKECVRLDQSLALALKHLILPHQRTAPGTLSHTEVEGQAAVSQCQQLSSLLQVAASHGLRTVASFLLQQPGGREALRRPSTQGLTPACLAKSRGHQQLVELFTQYEKSLNALEEPKEQLQFYPEGRVFQHHARLGTYTLSFPSLHQSEGGAETQSSEGCYLQEEVMELRRLIHLHKEKKGNSDFPSIPLTDASTSISINHEAVSPACVLQPYSHRHQESKQDAGPAAVSIENCNTTTKKQGSPLSLEERTQEEDSAVVTHTSCTTESLYENQEAGGKQKSTPAAKCLAGRNRKNKKRTTKTTRHATESPGNNKNSPGAGSRTTLRPTKTTGSTTGAEGSVSPSEPVEASVISDRGPTKTQCHPETKETPSSIQPLSAPGRKRALRKTVALPTTIDEKQEEAKWEVDLLICEPVVETEFVTETEQGRTESLPVKEVNFNLAIETAAERTATMGQEQSQEDSKLDQDEPSQPDKSPQSGRRTGLKYLNTEGKPQRGLWLEGGWIESRMGSPPRAPKTVWYQDETLHQGDREDRNTKELNSQSVWYDSDTVYQREHEHVEQGMREQKECSLSSTQDSGLSSPQLLEQGLSSHQLPAALRKPHAAGTQPALSHGPGAQRQEVHGPQQEEEVRPDWKEGGVKGDREKVSNTETTYSRKSTEAGKDKHGREEKGAKGRKKRRKKRGNRVGTEAELSSSSSVESQSQIKIQTQREQVTNLNTQSETESAATDKTGRGDTQSLSASEPAGTEEADKDAMHLPSQTEGLDLDTTALTEVTAPQTLQTKELSEKESTNLSGTDDHNSHSTFTASEIDSRTADTGKITTMRPIQKEVLAPTKLDLLEFANPVQEAVHDMKSRAFSENGDLTVTGEAVACSLVGLIHPEERPVTDSESTEFTEDSFLEQSTQRIQCVDSDEPVEPVDPMGKSNGFMKSVHPTEAGSLPSEGTADVSPLQKGEGRAERPQREYLEHCLSSEMMRDQQHEEEKRGEKVENEEFPSSDKEKEQNYNRDLVATAIAVVTVAIASAMSSIELSQQLADNQSESQERDSKEPTNDKPLPQDTALPADKLYPLADELLSTQATQLSAQHLVQECCQLLAVSPAEAENQPKEHSNSESTDQFTCSPEANVKILEEQHSNSETEKITAAQQSNNQQADRGPSILADNTSLLHDKEKIQTETVEKKIFMLCPPPKTKDGMLQVNMKPLPEASEMITTEVDCQGHMQTEIQLQEVSPRSCPVIDTGQHTEASDTLCSDPEENPRVKEQKDPQSLSSCQKESEIHTESDRQQLDLHIQHSQTPDGGNCHPGESITAAGEEEGQIHEQYKADTRENSVSDMSSSDGQAKELSDAPWDYQAETLCEGETPTLFSWGSTLPAHPCDLTLAADPRPEERICENQSTPTLANMKLVTDSPLDAGSGSFQSRGQEAFALDTEDGVFEVKNKDSDTLDTVDGWKARQRNDMNSEEEAKKDTITVEDGCPTEGETIMEAKQDRQQVWSGPDSEYTLQIQRERDVFSPVKPCLEPTKVTTCEDIHPDREECVSTCLFYRDKHSLEVGTDVNDSFLKQPEDPPPCLGHRDRELLVSCSSIDDALIQGDLCSSGKALSVGSREPVSSQSSTMSWRSETEGKGSEKTEGEEEEKKVKLEAHSVAAAILRASLSPFRRHSWEPGRNSNAGDGDITQRSSLKSVSGEAKIPQLPLHRRSMSWCPSSLCRPDQEQIHNRSFSLEGLEVEKGQCPVFTEQKRKTAGRSLHLETQERAFLVSLTEEKQEGDRSSTSSQTSHQILSVTTSCPAMFHHQTLAKSISMVAISPGDIDVTGFPRSNRRTSFSLSISLLRPKNRRFFSGSSSSEEEEGGMVSSFCSNSASLEYSISEEEPGPLRSDTEGKGGPKISRTFSYLRSKMSKKGKEKEKEKRGERERESKEREKKSANGHVFIPVSRSPSSACHHCAKLLHNKEMFLCDNCGVHVHKSCRESLSVCMNNKTKQQSLMPEGAPGSAVIMRSTATSSTSSVSSASSSSSRERWSVLPTSDGPFPVGFSRRPPSIFNPHSNLAKSISTSNIAGLDDVPLKGLKFLSQSTDSLHQGSKVNASTESLTDEGTEMVDSMLMGEFECDIKDLEADSWSGTVDKKFLKALKKDEIKRQDVIYELYQTEFHHVRTLKIMSEVYHKGLQKELQLDTHALDKIFPVLDDLLDVHTHFLTLLLERKRASSAEGQSNNSFFIRNIGDVLVNQFSGCNADSMKKVYGRFCSRHNEAVNHYKDLHAKDKRFQAFIKRTMSSSIVRRLSIPECILLVTQRITKYPVLIQRILQHTKDTDGDHSCVSEALCCVKELITAVDCKVNEQEKKQRLREVYSRTDSKSIMRMKSGQMFAKEDLIRGRKLLHDGALQLKNSAGRLKDVHAMLLSDVLVFLQEKDQKYVFASLDQRSTVISLHNLIVREVANEERGLFLITAGIERPEMVEVLASSKEERNTWRAIIQDAMHCMEKDEDEGVPSETEEDKRQQENRAKEIRELLRKKDQQIISLLEEKVHIFRDLADCTSTTVDINPPLRERLIFRATPEDVTKGEPIIKDALREVETLHAFVNSSVGGAGCSLPVELMGSGVGPVSLPRRAETFGGFDCHQMNSSKNGEKEEGEESLDLRRTESDSVLKKGATTSMQMLLKRSSEQVQHSVTHLHNLLITLQAVVVQQDSFIEDQRQALSDRLAANSRHSSSSSLSSSSSSRPSSLIEQEKHRSLERQRQEASSLQKQQAAHQDEKRKREKAWEVKEKCLAEREERVRLEEEGSRRRRQELMEERETLQRKKEEYQRQLERLMEAQRRLERDQEALQRDTEKLEAMKRDESEQLQRYQRTPSTTSEDSIRYRSSGSLDLDFKQATEQPKEVQLPSSAPTKEPFLCGGSKRMGKNFNPFSSSSSSSKPQGAEKESQLPARLLQLAKPKEKKDKKKKGKGAGQTQIERKVMLDPQNDGDIFFC